MYIEEYQDIINNLSPLLSETVVNPSIKKVKKKPAITKKSKKLRKNTIQNRLAQKLGYLHYDHYLSSDLWKEIRSRLLPAYCECGEQAVCIHHNKYTKEILLGKDLSGLEPLCNKCHYKRHFFVIFT
jgi:hypothetical protein